MCPLSGWLSPPFPTDVHMQSFHFLLEGELTHSTIIYWACANSKTVFQTLGIIKGELCVGIFSQILSRESGQMCMYGWVLDYLKSWILFPLQPLPQRAHFLTSCHAGDSQIYIPKHFQVHISNWSYEHNMAKPHQLLPCQINSLSLIFPWLHIRVVQTTFDFTVISLDGSCYFCVPKGTITSLRVTYCLALPLYFLLKYCLDVASTSSAFM